MELTMLDAGDRFFYRGDVRGLQLRLYRPGDEHQVDARADFRAAFEREDCKLPDGPKWTLLDGVKVLAVGGLEDDGCVWRGWAYCAPLTPRQWLFAAWCARACMGWARGRGPTGVTAVGYTAVAQRLLRRIGLKQSELSPFIFLGAA